MNENYRYNMKDVDRDSHAYRVWMEMQLTEALRLLREVEWTEVGVDVREGEARHCPYCYQAEPAGHGEVYEGGWSEPCPLGAFLERHVK